MKKVAVIILTFNAEKYLPKLLGSIFSNPPKSVQQEIIIVDNNSSDKTLEYVSKNLSAITVLSQKENWGFAKGNNIGMAYAISHNFDFIMLLNQDTIVTEGYLDELVSVLESDEKLAAVQPRLMLYPQVELVNSLGSVIHYLGFGYTYGHRQKFDQMSWKKEINYCSGAACLIKVNLLQKVGLFWEDLFMYHEDLDLGWRFKLAGLKQQLVSQAVVYHEYDFSRSIKKYFFMERNRFLVLFCNYHLLTLILIFPMLFLMEIGLFGFSFKNGWWKEKIKVYAYFFSSGNWRKIKAHRRQTQGLRTLKERGVISDFSGVIDHQEVNNPLLKVTNPILNGYWLLIKLIMLW
jgi:GT2 family glycosyltransferase